MSLRRDEEAGVEHGGTQGKTQCIMGTNMTQTSHPYLIPLRALVPAAGRIGGGGGGSVGQRHEDLARALDSSPPFPLTSSRPGACWET